MTTSRNLVQGYAVWTSLDGPAVKECDTFTCCHCNRIVMVKMRAAAEDLGGFCRMCMKMCCPSCADKGCTPFEKRMEKYEARQRLLAAVNG